MTKIFRWASNLTELRGCLVRSMAIKANIRLWMAGLLMVASACQRNLDQPRPDPLAAPSRDDVTVLLASDGTGSIPLPDSTALKGGAITIRFSNPRYGTIVADSKNLQFIYKAGPSFPGADTATCTLIRGGGSSTGKVFMAVDPFACLPILNNDSITVHQTGTNAAFSLNVLSNDTRCQDAQISLVNKPPGFTLNGFAVRYTPPNDSFIGTVSAQYQVVNAAGYRQQATASFTVLPRILPPGCTTPFQAHDDTIFLPTGTDPTRIHFFTKVVGMLFTNDSSCPGALDSSSIVFDNVSWSRVQVQFNPTTTPNTVKITVNPGTDHYPIFRYRVWTHDGLHNSRATVTVALP